MLFWSHNHNFLLEILLDICLPIESPYLLTSTLYFWLFCLSWYILGIILRSFFQLINSFCSCVYSLVYSSIQFLISSTWVFSFRSFHSFNIFSTLLHYDFCFFIYLFKDFKNTMLEFFLLSQTLGIPIYMFVVTTDFPHTGLFLQMVWNIYIVNSSLLCAMN